MSEQQQKNKRILTGVVTSSKMDKTIVVLIERKVKHPIYGKYIKRSTKVYAHDPENICKEGDVVMVTESRPISKTKNWMLLKILEKEV
jgi:small subunit ribosomal protein S17